MGETNYGKTGDLLVNWEFRKKLEKQIGKEKKVGKTNWKREKVEKINFPSSFPQKLPLRFLRHKDPRTSSRYRFRFFGHHRILRGSVAVNCASSNCFSQSRSLRA